MTIRSRDKPINDDIMSIIQKRWDRWDEETKEVIAMLLQFIDK